MDRYLPLTPLTHAVLLALLDADLHGYAIIKEVGRVTGGAVRPGTGTLYTALQRMQDEGLLVESRLRPDPGDDPRRRYYRVTELGRAVARAEAQRLVRTIQVACDKALLPSADLTPLVEGR